MGKKALWIWLGIALAILALVLAGLFTEWFGLGGPLTKIGLAAADLGNAGSFTAELQLQVEDIRASGKVAVQMDLADRLLQMKGYLRIGLLRVNVGIYDDRLLVWYDDIVKTFDISKELDDLYASAAGGEKKDPQEVLRRVFAAIGAEACVDTEKAEKCLLPAALTINRTPWLEQNLAMTVQREDGVEIFAFRPKLKSLPKSLLAFFEDAFLTGEDYDATLRKLTLQCRALGTKVEPIFSVGVLDGKLHSLQFELTISQKNVALSAEFSKIGNTTVDTDALKQILNGQ